MTFFAVFLFVAFAVVALTSLGSRVFRRYGEIRTGTAIFWGVSLAWLANLNMWTSWHITNLRYGWVGVTLTGIALAGTALVLHAAAGTMSSLYRKLEDEAEQIERTELRRVA
ncbi:MAG: hypothetical protein JWO62_1040 [Acidimicrobiaceae bacterium]|jgi:hypothetical protein|nr:hypothetical protein [Acidimicrobiaceae bacterium]